MAENLGKQPEQYIPPPQELAPKEPESFEASRETEHQPAAEAIEQKQQAVTNTPETTTTISVNNANPEAAPASVSFQHDFEKAEEHLMNGVNRKNPDAARKLTELLNGNFNPGELKD